MLNLKPSCLLSSALFSALLFGSLSARAENYSVGKILAESVVESAKEIVCPEGDALNYMLASPDYRTRKRASQCVGGKHLAETGVRIAGRFKKDKEQKAPESTTENQDGRTTSTVDASIYDKLTAEQLKFLYNDLSVEELELLLEAKQEGHQAKSRSQQKSKATPKKLKVREGSGKHVNGNECIEKNGYTQCGFWVPKPYAASDEGEVRRYKMAN